MGPVVTGGNVVLDSRSMVFRVKNDIYKTKYKKRKICSNFIMKIFPGVYIFHFAPLPGPGRGAKI